jgi:TM2 domain-containing membrane protein YozV
VYSVGTAYLLWFFLGWAGAHRFYLGKVGTGILYLFTGGIAGVGLFVDLFRIPSLVREANFRLRYHDELFGPARTPHRVAAAQPRESIERAILRIARKNRGTVTPSSVAVDSEFTVEQAQKALEKLAAGGHADMRIRDSGLIEYHFVEFEREA